MIPPEIRNRLIDMDGALVHEETAIPGADIPRPPRRAVHTFVGKPHPLMARSALNALDAHSETSGVIGDRMDADVKSGLEAGMFTVLVVTGSTAAGDIERYPYRPSLVADSVGERAGLLA